jgi:hypothetical protein
MSKAKTTPKSTNFRWDLRQWRTATDLAQHLANYDPSIADWAKGAVIHHTFRPEPRHWRGAQTMTGIKNYYEGLGWDSGPHLFLCVGAPNPADDGIWQMTALNERGIHATIANSWAWGIEVVGYFDYRPWSDAERNLVYDTVETLFRWRGIVPSKATLKGHREVPSPKTCPGIQIDMSRVRIDLQQRMGGA